MNRTRRLVAIRVAFLALLLGISITFSVQVKAAVGFDRLTYTASSGDKVEAGIWYPSDGDEKPEPLELFEQNVVRGGPIDGTNLPLVVISHGTGGSLSGHYDTALALARAGFVVAALTHPGDNFRDDSRALNIANRPGQVRELVDFMLDKWKGRHTISARRIGAFGFSAGGFAVLVLAGGRYDISLIQPHCKANPAEWACRRVAAAGMPGISGTPVPQSRALIADPRIRAAAIVAPALGYTFAKPGLDSVRIPLQLWRAANDNILPQPWHAQAVYDALPVAPQYLVVPNAGHYDFLAPCSVALAKVAAEICQSADGFDRTAFHRQFNEQIVDFFKANLAER